MAHSDRPYTNELPKRHIQKKALYDKWHHLSKLRKSGTLLAAHTLTDNPYSELGEAPTSCTHSFKIC